MHLCAAERYLGASALQRAAQVTVGEGAQQLPVGVHHQQAANALACELSQSLYRKTAFSAPMSLKLKPIKQDFPCAWMAVSWFVEVEQQLQCTLTPSGLQQQVVTKKRIS